MLFTSHYAQFVDGNGNPLNGGVVKFFEPGTSTPKDVYSDGELTTSIGSEVTLDPAGRAVIFLDGNYKVTLEDSAGVEVRTVDDVNVQDDPVTLVLTNPSFETAGNSSTDIPGWTLSAPSGVTVERVTTDNYHGAACLEITSDGTNAGYAETTDFISISPGREYEISFALESSSATVTNTVQVRWFDESQNLVSTTSVYNASSGNPTSWENNVFTATPPATARYAKIRAQLGATAGTTRYDDFEFGSLAGSGEYLTAENNLSDVDSASTSRTNLGLGSAATKDEGSGNGLDADSVDGISASGFACQVLNYGGDLDTTGDHLHFNGKPTDAVAGETNDVYGIVYESGFLERAAIFHSADLSSSSATIGITVIASTGGSPSGPSNITLDGSGGEVETTSFAGVAVSQGDLIFIEYLSGNAPGETSASLKIVKTQVA